MGNPEDLRDRLAAEDRQPGPGPQGRSPDEAPPSGGPTSSGAPPTGHPAASPDSHPADGQGPAEPEPALAEAPAETPAEAPVESPEDDSKPLRAAERALLKRYEKERADYLEQLQRTRADFENYRKRMIRQQTEQLERAAETLVEKLLPVLDNLDLALAHGQGFSEAHTSLIVALEKEGLTKIHPLDKPFDPTEADAVAHEDGPDGPVVAEVLRPGYRWKGRVLRPAMVRVRG